MSCLRIKINSDLTSHKPCLHGSGVVGLPLLCCLYHATAALLAAGLLAMITLMITLLTIRQQLLYNQ